ncbi:hypothetical protein [Paenibacillus sp. DMB20]|uniref:hypothetical protein n=1 Tax=Paenibacillus sp. DMB20 TaxID=1642570 RepID=UPI000627C87C|nr:hypothetical protein [Paenibacillus sp. DMB20]KKO53696.1 hypothetical protein XI25_11980 [Paenibacillus sp. DMB20]
MIITRLEYLPDYGSLGYYIRDIRGSAIKDSGFLGREWSMKKGLGFESGIRQVKARFPACFLGILQEGTTKTGAVPEV